MRQPSLVELFQFGTLFHCPSDVPRSQDSLASPLTLWQPMCFYRVKRMPSQERMIMAIPVLTIDVPARRVNLSGCEIVLTRKEFDVLTLICQNPHRVISRDEIFREVWGYSDLSNDRRPSWNTGVSGTRTLDMHMVTLRKKLGFAASASPIETVRGIGYRLDPSK